LKKYKSALIFSGVVLLVIGLWFLVPWAYARIFIAPLQFDRLEPGRLNLIGITLVGERIVVSNGVAQLEEGTGHEFSSQTGSIGGIGAPSGTRIPMRGLVGSLQLRPDSVSELVAALNRIDTNEVPPEDAIWTKAAIEKALSGDPVYLRKLERDIGSTLEGAPVEEFRRDVLLSGVYLRVPIPVEVPSSNGHKTVIGEVTIRYKTRIAQQVASHRLVKDRYEISNASLAGVYDEIAEQVKQEGAENVRASLERLISKSRAKELARPAELLLQRVLVLVNENQITDASISSQVTSEGEQRYTVDFDLTQEGKKRLWQYTHLHPGCQLLLVFDGAAIAAPVVQHEMKYSTVSITNIIDGTTAEEAVKYIKDRR
jgi:hypothetical protein